MPGKSEAGPPVLTVLKSKLIRLSGALLTKVRETSSKA